MTTVNKNQLLRHLREVERLANASKWRRFLNNPSVYLHAIWTRKVSYRFFKKTSLVTASLFSGQQMHLTLPAATDIYLTSGKTHASEIRLARYLIQTLLPGETFIDVGAHFGYYTLLASTLVGTSGRVYAYEASTSNHDILQRNVANHPNITIRNQAVCDVNQALTFYQFPALYSEYNAFDINQYKDEVWFKQNQPERQEIMGVTLNDILSEITNDDVVIKIDVEGAEERVIQGGTDSLRAKNATVIMEYLHPARGNAGHRSAAKLLMNLGYRIHLITQEGTLTPVDNVDAHLVQQGADSDNIVFKKD